MSATFDRDHAQAFLSYIYEGVPGLVQIVDNTRNFTGPQFATDPAGLEMAARYASNQDTAKGIYFRATTMTGAPEKGRGGVDLTAAVPVLWADLDYGQEGHKRKDGQMPNPPTAEDAKALVAEAGLPDPTVWVYSGGGWYPLWKLARPVAVDEAALLSEGIQQAIERASNAHGWHYGTGVSDLARVLRLPGSINRKSEDNPRPCRAVSGTGQLIDPDTLPKAELKAPKSAPQATAPRDTTSTGSYRSGTGPFDALAESVSWADLLEPADWTYVGNDSAGELWLRPGGSDSEYSARAFEHNIVVHSESADLPSGADQRLTKGRLFAHLWHAGDLSAASRDLVQAAWGTGGSNAARGLPVNALTAIKRATDDMAAFGFDSSELFAQAQAARATVVSLPPMDQTYADTANEETEVSAIPEKLPMIGSAGPRSGPDQVVLANHVQRYVANEGVRYCSELGGWLVFVGTHWSQEAHMELVLSDQIRRWISNVADAWRTQAKAFVDLPDNQLDDEQRKIRTQAMLWTVSRQNATVTAVMQILKERLVVDRKLFDSDPWKLNTPDGLIDLRTGEIETHSPRQLCLRITRGSYKAGAEHPRWTQALEAVSDDCMAFFRLRVGQSSTGFPTHDDAAMFVVGSGENGKSALFLAVMEALGTYAGVVPKVMLLGGSAVSREAELARGKLVGLRMALMEELPENGFVDSNKLKELAGTPSISYRQHYQDHAEASATHSLWVTTNHLPALSTTDHATWRRTLPMPLPYRFLKPGQPVMDEAVEKEGDLSLKPFIQEEAGPDFWDAVTTWIIDSARVFSAARPEARVIRPQRVLDALADWQRKANPLILFVQDHLEPAPGGYVSSFELYEGYRAEVEAGGNKPLSSAKFREQLIDVLKAQYGVTSDSKQVKAAAGRSYSVRASKFGVPSVAQFLNGEDGRAAYRIHSAVLPSGKYWSGLRWKAEELAPEEVAAAERQNRAA